METYAIVRARLQSKIGDLKSIYPINQFQCVFDAVLAKELTENPISEDAEFNIYAFGDQLVDKMIEVLLLNQVNNDRLSHPKMEAKQEEWLVI